MFVPIFSFGDLDTLQIMSLETALLHSGDFWLKCLALKININPVLQCWGGKVMMSSDLEYQSVLQLSKCHMKLKVEFWRVQLVMCYYFIIFNRRVLLIFLLRTHVDLERLNNGQPCQQWKGWVLSMAGGAHPDWSLRGKTVTPLTCISTSKSLSGCVTGQNWVFDVHWLCPFLPIAGSTWEKTFRQIGFERWAGFGYSWPVLFQQFTDYPLVVSPPLLQWPCSWVSRHFWASVSL